MMPTSGTKSLEMMIGGLLQATQDMQRDITEIRRDIKDSDARAALSYKQSEQRAASSRAKMYQKTDELVERVTATESAVSKLNADMTSVNEKRGPARYLLAVALFKVTLVQRSAASQDDPAEAHTQVEGDCHAHRHP